MGVHAEPVHHSPNSKIDHAFVLPPEHRPAQSHDSYKHTTDHIPVIDLAPLHSSSAPTSALQTLVLEVGHACRQWGFFQVVNHGVPPHVITRLREETRAFFALPLEEKRKVKRTYENALGYNDTELTKNVRDWKEVFDFAVQGVLELPVDFEGDNAQTQIVENQWPINPQGLRDACEQYSAAAEKLALSLLELISLSLGLPASHFQDYFKPGTTMSRLNHYPVCPDPGLALGVSRHKDPGALTILLQDEVGGLQVSRKDGEWIGVKPDPAGFVINLGDMIQVWSDDKFQSVEHRVVVNENKDRYSFPVFLNPNASVDVSPIPELIDELHPPKYKPINWGKFYKRRKDGNFENLGVENLQIHHYAHSI